MPKYMTIKPNDVANAPGVNVSVYLSGCPHHCKGCFNPETWDFEAGQYVDSKFFEQVRDALLNNNIYRDLCILGGEPMYLDNLPTTLALIEMAHHYNRKAYVWTGYLIEDLIFGEANNPLVDKILDKTDYIIDGPFIEEHKDITLQMRGSSNQRIFIRKEDGFYETTAEYLTNK